MNQTKIGAIECIATIGCVNIIPLILTIPTFTAQTFGTGSFAQTVYTILISIIAFSIIFKLFFKFQNKDFIDISEYAGGKTLKYISGIIIISYLILSTVLVLSEFNENIRNMLLKNAPSEYIYLLFIAGMLVGVFSGIKGIFRTGTIIAPVILISLIFMFFALISDVDVTNYTPIFGNDLEEFFITGAFRLEIFEGMFLILLMGTHLKDVKKATIGSFIIISLIVLLITSLLFGLIPYPASTENYFPFFELSRLISYGRFVQRLESFYTLLWLIAVYIYISLDTSYALHVFSKIFNLKYSKRLAPLFCVLILTLALILNSYITVLSIRKFLIDYIIPVLGFGYSITVLFIAFLKQKRRNNEKA